MRATSRTHAKPPVLIAYAALGPLVHASIALALAVVLRIPVANPSLYFGLSLEVTFPLNILLGILLYTSIAKSVIG